MGEWQRLNLDGDPHDLLPLEWEPGEIVDAFGELQALLERPAWHQYAACRGQGPDAWFPERGSDTATVRETCDGCPVRAECADAGLDEPAGIWGGLSGRQRRHLRTLRPKRPPRMDPMVAARILVAFADDHAPLGWPGVLAAWNDEHPERAYGKPGSFAGAVAAARRRCAEVVSDAA